MLGKVTPRYQSLRGAKRRKVSDDKLLGSSPFVETNGFI